MLLEIGAALYTAKPKLNYGDTERLNFLDVFVGATQNPKLLKN